MGQLDKQVRLRKQGKKDEGDREMGIRETKKYLTNTYKRIKQKSRESDKHKKYKKKQVNWEIEIKNPHQVSRKAGWRR